MPSINLAPGTQYVIIARKRKIRLYAIAVGIIIIFLVGGGGLYFYVQSLQSSSDEIKNQITAVDQKIQALREDALRVAFFEKRLTDTSQLLSNHIGWNKVFADLERLLPADTVFTSFDASSSNSSITVKGTTQNIDQVGLALASLTKDVNHASLFEKGSVKTIQRQSQPGAEGASAILYAFDMMLEFNKNALSKTTL